MAIHYKGVCKDFDDLPLRAAPAGAVQFREPSAKVLALVLNTGAVVLMVLLAVPFLSLAEPYLEGAESQVWIGLLCAMVATVPHELLHAICFKDDAGVYLYPKGGALFVLGLEDMSKGRFVFMSLLPNIVFGWVPYFVFLLFPHLVGLGVFGMISSAGGFGDYANVFNALTQVPKGATVYMSGAHTFWYPKAGA